MAEWFKAAVLKTVVRKYRGFESYSLRHIFKTCMSVGLKHNLFIFKNNMCLKIRRGGRVGLRRTPAKCVQVYPLPRVRIPPSPPRYFHLMIKHNFFNSPYQKGFLILSLIFIFVGFISCSIGTDKSASLPEKPLNKLKFNKEGQMIELEHRTASAKATMAEGSGIKIGGHPPIDYNKIIHRKICVFWFPSENHAV